VGATARKMVQTPATPVRPRFAVVRGGRSSASSRRSTRAAVHFRVAVACLALVACAGVLRVSLAVQAAEAAIDASALRAELKEERQNGRVLEANKGALAAPSRIEELASQTLSMRRPAEVNYIHLPDALGAAATTPAAADAGDVGSRLGSRILTTLMDLAAGEAQVLLVGDVGLGPLR